jgi:hypothetical protein
MKTIQIFIWLFLLINLLGCNEIDNRGFNTKTKMNSITKSYYDAMGYDYDGYDRNGFNKDGFKIDGFNKEGFDKDGFDKNGFNKDGIDNEGFNNEGFNIDGFNRSGFDKDGFNVDGFNKKGWNKLGINKETNTKYDKEGFDIYNTDINGKPNPLKFINSNSDDIFKIYWKLYELTNPIVLVKDEFEKSTEFAKRKQEAEAEKNKIKEEYSKKILVYNYYTYSGYDADKEIWNFVIQNIRIFEEKIWRTKKEFIGGEFVQVKEISQNTMVLNFSNPKTIKIPIEVDSAKNIEGFYVQILFNITNISKNSYNFKHVKPTKYSPNDISSSDRKLFAKYLGITIWDKDKKNLIYSDINQLSKPENKLETTTSELESEKLLSISKKNIEQPIDNNNVELLVLKKGIIKVGMVSDDFVEIVSAKEIINQIVEADPLNPNSLIVRKDCKVDNTEFSVILARKSDPGPYRVVSILSTSTIDGQKK